MGLGSFYTRHDTSFEQTQCGLFLSKFCDWLSSFKCSEDSRRFWKNPEKKERFWENGTTEKEKWHQGNTQRISPEFDGTDIFILYALLHFNCHILLHKHIVHIF